ncbi:hypothetical protein BGZ99_004092 [Dissophora globulifera]|uniref:Uncharacterized protein n=1 Tax=Dissophora globulifera TaxID=979702 RepID=A0A9P6RJM2_9FUNG|nr:hypothetical protein BGZ99_004092 [Dissophora globulifera]
MTHPPTGTKKQDNNDTSSSLTLGDLNKDVNPADASLSPLNSGSMMKSLHNVDMGELQDWFDIGADIYKAVKTTGHASESNSQNTTGVTEAQKLEAEEDRVEVDNDLFNKVITKAAGFANRTLTPDMVEGSGVFDRLHDTKVL